MVWWGGGSHGSQIHWLALVPNNRGVWHDNFSPLVICLQYLSTFLQGSNRRILLVWRFFGCLSYGDWCARLPGQVRQIRRKFKVASASIYRRQYLRLRGVNLKWIAMGDPRHPLLFRQQLMDEFIERGRCLFCLPVGFWRIFWTAVYFDVPLRDYYLTSDGGMDFWYHLAWLLTLQCADIEWRHARNRARSSTRGQSCGIAYFTAKYVTNELATIHKVRGRELEFERRFISPPVAEAEEQPGVDDQGDQDEELFASWLRCPTVAEMFKFRFLRSERSAGRASDPTGEAFIIAWRSAFDALSEGELLELQAEALTWAPVARMNRLRKKACRGADAQVPEPEHVAKTRPPDFEHNDDRRKVSLNDAMHTVDLSNPDGNVLFQAAVYAPLEPHRQYPMSESQLSPNVDYTKLGQAEHDVSDINGIYDSFLRTSSMMVVPVASDRRFPAEVTHSQLCGPVCKYRRPASEFRWYHHIVKGIPQVASQLGKPSEISEGDTFLAVFCYDSAVADATPICQVFVWFDTYTAQSGHHAPTAVFTLTTCTTEPVPTSLAECMGRYFTLRRHEFIKPDDFVKMPPPMERQSEGRLMHMTHEGFAEMLVRKVGEARWGTWSHVRFHRLVYKDIDLNTVQIEGFDENYNAVDVFPPPAATINKRKRRKSNQPFEGDLTSEFMATTGKVKTGNTKPEAEDSMLQPLIYIDERTSKDNIIADPRISPGSPQVSRTSQGEIVGGLGLQYHYPPRPATG